MINPEKNYILILNQALKGDKQARMDLQFALINNELSEADFNKLFVYFQQLPSQETCTYYYLKGRLYEFKNKLANKEAIVISQNEDIELQDNVFATRDAIIAFEKAIELKDNDAFIARYNIYLAAKDLSNALKLCEKGIELSIPSAMRFKAKRLLEEGKYEAGFNLLEQAIALDEPIAMQLYAIRFWEGKNCIQSYSKATNLWIRSFNILSDKWPKNKRTEQLKYSFVRDMISELPNYLQLKLLIMTPNLPYEALTKPSLIFFSEPIDVKTRIINLLEKDPLEILQKMASDEDLPVPMEKQIELCTHVLKKDQTFGDKVLDDQTKALRKLIGKTYLSLAKNVYDQEKDTNVLEAYQQAFPYLNKALLILTEDEEVLQFHTEITTQLMGQDNNLKF